MYEYLPSIDIQKGFYYTNNFYNHQRYYSKDTPRKNYYPNYNYLKYNNPYRPKQDINNNSNNYGNNFLKISNINKDEINSLKNNTGVTFYNKSSVNYKKLSNNKIQNNIFSQTYNNYYQKFREKYSNNNFNSKSQNNIKIIQGNRNNIKDQNIAIKDFNLLLPDFQNEKYFNNKDNNHKIKLTGKTHSYSVSNKENKNNNNNIFNLNNNNYISYDKIDNNKKLLPRGTNKLTSVGYSSDNNNNNLFLLQTKSYTKKKGVSQDNRYSKPYKTINLLNKNNNNSSTKRICPLCHKELEKNRYKYHFGLHPSQIFDWLFLGSYRNALDKQEIKALEINYILNCAGECFESFPEGIKYCHLKLNDVPSFKILPYLDKASFFIHQAKCNNGKILVHCQMGISRSTSCVIAYMIKYMGYSSMNALSFIKKKRPMVMPNFGFLQQLLIYEKNNMGTDEIVINEKNEYKQY